MLKSLAIVFTILTGATAAGITTESYVRNQDVNMHQSTVQLGKYCSGTVINDPTGKGRKTVLTARHCIDEGAQIVEITVPTINEQGQTTHEDSIKFDVVRISDKSDLALLQSDSKLFNYPAMAIYSGSLNIGDPVLAIGYPSGGVITLTSGFIGPIEKVPAFYSISKTGEFRRSSTLVAPGSSGGSLVKKGWFGPQLVGVATGMNLKYQFQTFWTPIEEIRAFIEEVKKPTFEEVYNDAV